VIVFLLAAAGFLAFFSFESEKAGATTIYVGSGAGNHTTSIQDAIDNFANDGDTVFVYSGTYYEYLIIQKRINLVGEDRDTTIINASYTITVIYVGVNRVNVTGFTVTGSSSLPGNPGIKLDTVQFCRISNNNVYFNGWTGIALYFSSNNIIENNNVSSNGDDGILIDENSNYNTIANNTVSNNDMDGITISYRKCNHNTIANNTVSSNYDNGIFIWDSIENKIIDNIVSDNRYGIQLWESSGNTLINNQMWRNGIHIFGEFVDKWNTHSIDTSNYVNGKPVYFWKNQNGGTIPPGAGEVILANCTNVKIENQNVSYSSVGIELGFSTNNIIANITASFSNMYGIYLCYSDGNTLTNNTASTNGGNGFYFYFSNRNNLFENIMQYNENGIVFFWCNYNFITDNDFSQNTYIGITISYSHGNSITNNNASNTYWGIRISDSNLNNITYNYATFDTCALRISFSNGNMIANNNFVNNGDAIYLSTSSNFIIKNNQISNNNKGIHLEGSLNNLVYHNNIIDNSNQAYDDTNHGNQWDNGYPVGGNFWSDFNEPAEGAYDDFSGPDQNLGGIDNIVDNGSIGGGGINPYMIDSNSWDTYPLIFLADITPPTIWNLQPPDGSITTDSTPLIRANYDDPSGINVSSVVILVDGMDVTSISTVAIGNVIYIPASILSDGIHTVYIEVEDNYGNRASVTWTFIVDTTPPVITNLQPPDTSTTNETKPLIGADYYDQSGIDVSSVVIKVDGIDVTLSAIVTESGVNYLPVIALSEGVHTVYVEVRDNVGNLASVTWSFTVEFTLPAPTNLITETVNLGQSVKLAWEYPLSFSLDHFLIYRADSQTEFDFTNPYNSSATWPDPKSTTWIDPDSSVTSIDDDFYYIVRAANFDESDISSTSNTAGVWTRTFEPVISTFSLPLEPYISLTVEALLQDMNATYIKWMDPATSLWMKHGEGHINDNQLRQGQGYEVKFASQTTYTFCGMPAAMIKHNQNSFVGFDFNLESDSLMANTNIMGDVTLSWTQPLGMDFTCSYKIYRAIERDGFFEGSAIHVATIPFGTVFWIDMAVAQPGTQYYYMIVPENATGVAGTGTYSVGIWTEGFVSGYDTIGIPLKMGFTQTIDWYTNNIYNALGINYYINNEQRWGWHSKRMQEGIYDGMLEMCEGYQISTLGPTKFTFIGV
jgi:parallel beta-helix repeat protein